MTNWYCQHGVLIPGSCADCFRDRRDRFAAAALAGLLANHADHKWAPDQTATFAVMSADALIAALDKPKEPTP